MRKLELSRLACSSHGNFLPHSTRVFIIEYTLCLSADIG